MFVSPGARAGVNIFNGGRHTGSLKLYNPTADALSPVLDLSQTWNNSDATFTGVKVNVTKTAANTASRVLDFQINGTSFFYTGSTDCNIVFNQPTAAVSTNIVEFRTAGTLVSAINGTGYQIVYNSPGADQFVFATNNAGTCWLNLGAGAIHMGNEANYVLALRQAANAHTLRVYNTADSGLAVPTNYERAKFGWNSNVLEIGAEAGGTGTARSVIYLAGSGQNHRFQVGGVDAFAVRNGGNGVYIYSSWSYFWGGSDAMSSADTGLSRNAAGVVEVNNGTPGTFRDLKTRNLFATIDDTTNNTVLNNLTLTRTTSNGPADGIGVSMAFDVEAVNLSPDMNLNLRVATISAVATGIGTSPDITDGEIIFSTMLNTATAAERLRITSTGVNPSVRILENRVTLTDAATVSLDASAGNTFKLLAGGNRTIDVPTNKPASGKAQKIVIAHEASGADRTLSLTTGSAGAFRFGTDITALTATTNGLVDYIGCIYNESDDRWDVVSYVKGY